MAGIINYTTKVEVSKTASEISAILVAHGARAVIETYDAKGELEGLAFSVVGPSGPLDFKMPVSVQAVFAVLERQRIRGEVRRTVTMEQSARVAWRILKDWVEIQMALVRLEMVKLEEVFLPYMLGSGGETLYHHMVESGQLKSLSAGRAE